MVILFVLRRNRVIGHTVVTPAPRRIADQGNVKREIILSN
jgi:hypothetical protein